MAISFGTIPSSGLMKPLFYVEIDNSKANIYSQDHKFLIIGQKTSAGSAATLEPVRVSSAGQARQLFGAGSVLAGMVAAHFANNTIMDCVAVALPEPTGGTAATGTITITSAPTSAGTIFLYVAGTRVSTNVSAGDTVADVAAKIVSKINGMPDLPITATAAAGVVTMTHKQVGSIGNDCPILVNFGGADAGESLPAGLALTVSQMAGGAGVVDLTDLSSILPEGDFEYIISAYSDVNSLNILRDFMAGRWGYSTQRYGHVFTAKAETFSELVTFGESRNDPHVSILGCYGSPSPSYVIAAAAGTVAGRELTNDPARPIQSLVIKGVVAPKSTNDWAFNEANILLSSGIATTKVVSGELVWDRCVTTFQKNLFGDSDISFLDVETPATLARVNRELRSVITSKYARHKLAADGTRFGAGQAIVTPAIIKAELIAIYQRLETLGLVERSDIFAKGLIVERDISNPNRLNVRMNPDLINQLRIFAVQNQFVLESN
ncbi:phage tail sheath C-terminal domain-containing protein [Novispirillum itersonii]|uniref:phage tail sheath C-terminal domain-containing protein n=1 Tax=Novispirillum itersonii TaxID=189 RepID=UPI0003709A3F|nr:phage tail sheath C-terminal domain-containing protein [Novispirillum itersonii]